MLALRITSIKNFMNQFLAGNAFDPFLTVEGTLMTSITYTFDGHLNKEFDESESSYEFQPWTETQKNVFSLVKGNNTPLLMKFMLQLMPEKAEAMLAKEDPDTDYSQLKGLLLNIKYEGGTCILTTGTSYHTFVMNHEADKIWDKNLQKYLTAKGIEFEIM